MPGFDPIALRPEEQKSGFSPGDLADLFELERLPIYPGKQIESPVESSATAPEDILLANNADDIGELSGGASMDVSSNADAMMAMQMAASMARMQEDDDVLNYQPPADLFDEPLPEPSFDMMNQPLSAISSLADEPLPEPSFDMMNQPLSAISSLADEPLPEPSFDMMNQPLSGAVLSDPPPQAFTPPAIDAQPFTPPAWTGESFSSDTFPSFAEPIATPAAQSVPRSMPAPAQPGQAQQGQGALDPAVVALMQSELHRSEKRKQKKAEDREKEFADEPLIPPPPSVQAQERVVTFAPEPGAVHHEIQHDGTSNTHGRLRGLVHKFQQRFRKRPAKTVSYASSQPGQEPNNLDPLFTRKRLMVLGVPLLLFTVLGVSAYIWFGMLHKPLPFFAKTSADSAKALAKKDEHSQAHDTTHTAGGHQEKQSHDTVQQEHHDTPHHTPLADNIGTSQVEEHKSDTHTSGSDHASKPETQQTLALEKDESPLKEEHPALVRKQMIAKEELRPSDRKVPAGKTKSLAGKGNNKTVSTKRSGTSLAHATMKHKAPVQKTKTKNEPVRPMATASTNGVFSVQVYASPSSDDAQQWLGKLRQKKIGSGFVSIQDVRGKKWYRVRFGSYPTLQEAQQMASQSGFGTAWVVRLR